MNTSIRRICLTPTRNEAWIVGHFLAAAKRWASDIIVIDQNSTDGTREQLTDAGVNLIINDSPVYDESYRQRKLIEKARTIGGKRIVIALDADEALSANCVSSKEWAQLNQAEPGTVLRFRWVNILPDFKLAWIPPNLIPCGFIDDGAEHFGERIHSQRVPSRVNAPVIDLQDVVVLHFQYLIKERVTSKHRWYQAWERINFPEKSTLQIFRQYHHMYGSWGKGEVQPVKTEWFDGYFQDGVDFRTVRSEPITWWDQEIVGLLRKHGTNPFRKVAIWDSDWTRTAERLGFRGVNFADPRAVTEKLAHRLLMVTQKHRTNWGVRGFERLLRMAGW